MLECLEGYHGTSRTNADSILASRTFIVSGSYRDWLGRGVYFFEKDEHQAYMIAKYRNRLEDADVAVLCADIDTEKERFIDLLIDEDRKFIEEYARRLDKKIQQLKNEIGEWEHKEGYVLDYLYREQPYDVVRAVYETPSRKKASGSILSYLKVQIQICVKETNCIKADSIAEVNCDAYRRL